MNIFFWILVIAGVVLLWFCLSFAFNRIGGIGLRLFNDAKKEIANEEKENDTDE